VEQLPLDNVACTSDTKQNAAPHTVAQIVATIDDADLILDLMAYISFANKKRK